MTIYRAEAPAVLEAMRDDAWDVVVALEQESGQRLYGYALRLGVDSGRAADLVQEALLRLWRELGRRGRSSGRARLDIPDARPASRWTSTGWTGASRASSRDWATATAPRVMEIDSADRVAVWSQVDRLPDRQRQVVYLRYQADLSFDEVAEVMGITSSAARNHAYHGAPDAARSPGRGGSGRLMDEDTLQRSLRSRPPADPLYRPRLTDPSATIARADSTRPDRVHVHRPTLHTRFQTMNATLKLAAVAVLALAVGIGVVQLRPSTNNVGSAPSPSASPTESPTPARLADGPLPAGAYVAMPFGFGSGRRHTPPQTGCSEAIPDDDIRVTFTVPDGLSGMADLGVGLDVGDRNTPTWAAVIVERGAWLLTDPCQNGKSADIPVGPTAQDFFIALAGTELDDTVPVDITLAGYSGLYLELPGPPGHHRVRRLPPLGARDLRQVAG